MQMIDELTQHMAIFKHPHKGIQTNDVVQFMATLDYSIHEALQSARGAGIFKLSKNLKNQANQVCMTFHPS
jgi:hypothetical protein